jgi:SPP1 family predicted phage head-tail adaptor
VTAIGQLNRRVIPQTAIVADDGQGGKTVTGWRDHPTVWASVLPISSREQLAMGAMQSLATYHVNVRYDASLLVTQRLKLTNPAGVTLEIVGVTDPDGRRHWLELACAEVP